MTYWQLFHFASPVSFLAWYGEATISERLLSEWGRMIEQREPADSEALARFFAFAPEPGTTESEERFLMSYWNGWHLLVDYGSFGALREISTNYSVPIIQFTVPSGSDLAHLADVPDFRLDLMGRSALLFCFCPERQDLAR